MLRKAAKCFKFYHIVQIYQKIFAIFELPDKFEFLVKSKIVTILAAILDDVTHTQQR